MKRNTNVKKPIIYLHIGMNKTGSTSIQDYFFNNKDDFNIEGFCYPSAGLNSKGIHYGLSDAFGFYNNKINNDQDQDSKNILEELLSEIDERKPRKVLISSEYFILDKNMSKLKEFFKEYEVKIVIFFRRHDFWEESRYQQGLKTMVNPPWDPGIENFLKFHSKRSSNKYRYLVDKWALEFGSENIIVIPFEKQQNKPSLIETFLMRIDELSLYEKGNFKNRKLNTSLSFKACLLLEIFQRLEIDGTTRNKLISYAQTINRDEKKQTFLSNEMRRRVIEENQSDYEYIAKNF